MSNIAVIQTAFPGDVILCTPVFESLKSAGHYVVVVVRPPAEALIKYNPFIDKLIIYDKRKGVSAFLKAAAELKAENCEAALIVQRYFKSALLPIYAGIGKRVGYDIAPVRSLYTDEIHYDRNEHEVTRCLALCLGLSPISGFSPLISIPDNELNRVQKLLSQEKVNLDNFIVLAPGSVWATKRWIGYQELAGLLREKYNCDIALIGSQADYDICREISEPEHVFNLAGKTDLLQSSAVIKLASLAITNDSAPAHMAAAVGTPVVTVFGSTVPAFGFAPYSDKAIIIENTGLYCRPCGSHGARKCPEQHFRCMNEISARRVLNECAQFLSE